MNLNIVWIFASYFLTTFAACGRALSNRRTNIVAYKLCFLSDVMLYIYYMQKTIFSRIVCISANFNRFVQIFGHFDWKLLATLPFGLSSVRPAAPAYQHTHAHIRTGGTGLLLDYANSGRRISADTQLHTRNLSSPAAVAAAAGAATAATAHILCALLRGERWVVHTRNARSDDADDWQSECPYQGAATWVRECECKRSSEQSSSSVVRWDGKI